MIALAMQSSALAQRFDQGRGAAWRNPSGPPSRATSLAVLAGHVRAAAEAARSGDEWMLRGELRALASETAAMAHQPQGLPLSLLERRQPVATTREATGRGAS